MNDLVIKKDSTPSLSIVDLIKCATNLKDAQVEYLVTSIEIMEHVNRIEEKQNSKHCTA